MPVKTLAMAPNKPITMTIKYIDVWPNDTSKNNGKGYGASLALRGLVDGEDVRVYPKGFLDRNLQRLMQANVIDLGDYSDDPDEKYSIPVLDGDDIQLELEQPAGERYPAFVARNPRQFGATPTPKPGRETPKDDGYMDALVGGPSATAPNTPLTGEAAPAPSSTPKSAQVERMYLNELTFVLDQVVPKLAKADIPIDASAVNAMVATILIQQSKTF